MSSKVAFYSLLLDNINTMNTRDNNWLNDIFEQIWESYFKDVPRLNDIEVIFGQKSKRRLGSIRQIDPRVKSSKTRITLTSYFRDPQVPEYLIETTLAHEICHYAHGFASPLPKYSRYPHSGGIVDRELIKRGLGDKIIAQKKWLKTEWPKLIGESGIVRIRRKRINSGTNNIKRLIRMFGLLS